MALKPWRKGDVWWVRGWVLKKYYRLSTGYPVKGTIGREDVARWAAEREVKIRRQAHGFESKAPTLNAYWTETYRPVHTAKKRAPRVDRYLMAHALPVFGAVKMDAVTPSDCQRFLNARRGALHPNPGLDAHGVRRVTVIAEGSVQRLHGFLGAVWQAAITDGLLTVNPWRAIKRKPYEVRRRLVTAEEQAKLIKVLPPTWGRYLRFMIGTGLRLEGCRGIDPAKHLDLVNRRVTVTEKYGKTRTVPIPVALVPVLKKQLKVDGQLWPQDPSYHREVLAAACKKAGIPHRSPHDLRHTFGHRWLKGGGDIYTLAKILGDSLDVTVAHYAYLSQEDIGAKSDAVELGL